MMTGFLNLDHRLTGPVEQSSNFIMNRSQVTNTFIDGWQGETESLVHVWMYAHCCYSVACSAMATLGGDGNIVGME